MVLVVAATAKKVKISFFGENEAAAARMGDDMRELQSSLVASTTKNLPGPTQSSGLSNDILSGSKLISVRLAESEGA